jgi:hypothetical protein
VTAEPYHSGAVMTPTHCVFCGVEDVTREHIYRRTYRTYAGTNRYYRVDIATGNITPMAPHESAFNLTAKVVCQGCNGGWMDQLDNKVEPAVTAFFEGRQYECDAQMAKDIALWAAKTSAMRAFGGFDRGVTDDDIKYLYNHREPPADWVVYLGHTSTVGSTNERIYSINGLIDQTGHDATELPSGLLVPRTDTFLMQEHWWAVEEMLMIVFSLSGPAKTPGKSQSVAEAVASRIEEARVSAPPLIRLWPNPVAFTWPGDLAQSPIENFAPVLIACEAISDSLPDKLASEH